MSDIDLDEELLGLLDDQPKKSRKSKSSKSKKATTSESSKKRKRPKKDAGSDMELSDGSSSDAEPPPRHARGQKAKAGGDSEDAVGESDQEETFINPYPYEGKYINAEDKARLMGMSELERESILHERSEEGDKIRDRILVSNLVKQKGKSQSQQNAEPSKRSSRQVKATGVTDTKAKALGKLKQNREKKKRRAEQGSDSDGSYGGGSRRKSPVFSSDPETEEGEVDSDEARRNRKKGKRAEKKAEQDPASKEELTKILLPRRRLSEAWPKPWFADYVTGAWVRLSLGPDEQKQQVYRLCEITGLGKPASRTYKLDKHMTDILLEVRHGKDKKLARMDEISNSDFTDKEYARLINTLQTLNESMPTRAFAVKKHEELEKRKGEALTEADTQVILSKKNVNPRIQNPVLYKATLTAKIDAARAASNTELLTELEKDYADLTGKPNTNPQQGSVANSPCRPGTPGTPATNATPEKASAWAALNERNRKANREEIRKAEVAQQELRKKQALDGSVKVDPSARVRTTVRVMHDVRAGTPDLAASPAIAVPLIAGENMSKLRQGSKIEDIAGAMDVDLGDF